MTSNKPSIKSSVSAKKQPYGIVSMYVKDKDGNIVDKREQNIDSFLYSHTKIVFNTLKTGGWSLTTAANVVSMTSNVVQYAFDGNIASQFNSSTGYQGIVVGTGSTAVTYGDTALAAIVDHGTSAGQLSFKRNSTNNYDLNNRQYLQRSFENLSGNSITINECGIAVSLSSTTSTKQSCVLVVRDVLDSAITVANGQILTVVYEFKANAGNINWFTRNIQNMIGGSPVDPESQTSLYDTAGTRRTGSFTGGTGLVQSAGESNYGLVLSTSVGNATYTTYEVPNIIAHGNSTGQVQYFASTVKDESYDNTNGIGILEIQRSFLNSNNAPITINSVGLRVFKAVAGVGRQHIIDWQALPSPITLNTNEGETIVWRFEYEL
jgi:hypothetical protein